MESQAVRQVSVPVAWSGYAWGFVAVGAAVVGGFVLSKHAWTSQAELNEKLMAKRGEFARANNSMHALRHTMNLQICQATARVEDMQVQLSEFLTEELVHAQDDFGKKTRCMETVVQMVNSLEEKVSTLERQASLVLDGIESISTSIIDMPEREGDAQMVMTHLMQLDDLAKSLPRSRAAVKICEENSVGYVNKTRNFLAHTSPQLVHL
mmetsp:Transcript_3047/g.9306  ORF Transcript_3047/g.9306 Transcript_3047/m.9306 type:complete len:209 (+) Transcript_3047:131-757(+)